MLVLNPGLSLTKYAHVLKATAYIPVVTLGERFWGPASRSLHSDGSLLHCQQHSTAHQIYMCMHDCSLSLSLSCPLSPLLIHAFLPIPVVLLEFCWVCVAVEPSLSSPRPVQCQWPWSHQRGVEGLCTALHHWSEPPLRGNTRDDAESYDLRVNKEVYK